MAFCLSLIAFMPSFWTTALIVFAFFFAYYVYEPPYRGLYPDVLPEARYGTSQGAQHVLRGVAIGAALVGGGFLFHAWEPFPFLAAAVIGPVACAVPIFFLRENGGHGRVFRGVRAYLATSWDLFSADGRVRRFLVANAAWEGTFAAARTFVVLYITVGLHESVAVSSLALAAVAGGYTVAAVVAGRLATQFGLAEVILLGSAVYGGGYLLGGLPTEWHMWFLAPIFVVAIAGGAVSLASSIEHGLHGTLVAVDVALGGGCTLDAVGFTAATYLRGIDWFAVPTSLVAQVDAGIGGKTAINLPDAKNLVGAFHWPRRTIADAELLHTLPEQERREGMAEVVKTGLLAGEPLWELDDADLVRRCAGFKAAVCLRDPYDRGERAILNLGHTFAHALEASASYEGVTHGQAVALGLLAALRLSGVDPAPVEDVLDPHPVRVDRERAWQALQRDKKVENGRVRLVLLEAPGSPVFGVERPEAEVRAALDALIAG
jgi:hypothetical protein